jgi:hypothetical protein
VGAEKKRRKDGMLMSKVVLSGGIGDGIRKAGRNRMES